MTDQIDLDPLKSEERGLLTDADLHLVNLFEAAMNSTTEININEIAQKFVTEVSKFAPKDQSGLDPISFVPSFFQVLIHIASRVPHRNIGQDVLVRTVVLLQDGGYSDEVCRTVILNVGSYLTGTYADRSYVEKPIRLRDINERQLELQ